jgi:hypothetical protein
MKKIAIVYPAHYEQTMGGAELQISYLAKYVKQVGYEVYYVYLDEGTPIANQEQLILYPIAKLKTSKKIPFLYQKAITERLQKIKPDIIYTRYSSSWIGIVGRYARKHGIRHIHATASDNVVRLKIDIDSFWNPIRLVEIFYTNRGL